MLLDENNYKEQIHAITQKDWKPLIELIPKVESTSKFGEWAGGEKDEKETIVLYDNTSSAGTGFWSGTKSDGTFSGNNCKDWSTGNNSDNATLGQSYKFYNYLTLCY
jgi:hypothetical protein